MDAKDLQDNEEHANGSPKNPQNNLIEQNGKYYVYNEDDYSDEIESFGLTSSSSSEALSTHNGIAEDNISIGSVQSLEEIEDELYCHENIPSSGEEDINARNIRDIPDKTPAHPPNIITNECAEVSLSQVLKIQLLETEGPSQVQDKKENVSEKNANTDNIRSETLTVSKTENE